MRSQSTSTNASSTTSSAPSTGSVSHPNVGSAFCAFFSLRCRSAECCGHASIVFDTGGLNCSVAFSGASERLNPDDEKSCQLSVARFAARAYVTNHDDM